MHYFDTTTYSHSPTYIIKQYLRLLLQSKWSYNYLHYSDAGTTGGWGEQGGHCPPPQYFADQLTLLYKERADYPPTITTASHPPNFFSPSGITTLKAAHWLECLICFLLYMIKLYITTRLRYGKKVYFNLMNYSAMQCHSFLKKLVQNFQAGP